MVATLVATINADDHVDLKDLTEKGLDEAHMDNLEEYQIDDMIFDKEHYRFFLGLEDRNAVAWEKKLWPNGTIPFVFQDGIPSSWKTKMRSWAQKFSQRMSGCLKIR